MTRQAFFSLTPKILRHAPLLKAACHKTEQEKLKHQLINLARHTALLSPLLSQFQPSIHFTLLKGAGGYIPQSLSHPPSQPLHVRPKFELSLRHGEPILAHTWIHELVHCWQDTKGWMFLCTKEPPALLELESFIRIYLLCEAHAMVTAITLSYDLFQKGFDLPWIGALTSPNWRNFARHYEQKKDPHTLYTLWEKSTQRCYYERKANDLWHKKYQALSSPPLYKASSEALEITEADLAAFPHGSALYHASKRPHSAQEPS